jgi:UDP-N-acetylmuramate--alanine ligase
VWVVFQPHTTNRTWALFDQFAAAFGDADHALILPIYRPSGRETAGRAVTSEDLVAAMRRGGHHDARFVDGFAAASHAITTEARQGDLVLTMGAGDVTLLCGQLLEALGR